MVYDYKDEFFTALENTKKFGFDESNVKFNNNNNYIAHDYNMLMDSLMPVFKSTMTELGIPGNLILRYFMLNIIDNCGPFHYYLKPFIEELFNCDVYITSGYISKINKETGKVHNHYLFGLDDIEKALTGENKFPASHHVWLTLDSGEVIDLVYLTTILSNDKPEKFNLALEEGDLPFLPICGNPNDIKGFKYHPIIIGENILKSANYDIEDYSKGLYNHSIKIDDIDAEEFNVSNKNKMNLYKIFKSIQNRIIK